MILSDRDMLDRLGVAEGPSTFEQAFEASPDFTAAVRAAATRLVARELKRVPLTGTTALTEYLRLRLADEKIEQVILLMMDSRNHLIEEQLVSTGTPSFAPCHHQDIARRALRAGAVGVIMVHNHPSGTVEPSAGDIEMTGRVRDALRTLDIKLIDHVIVAGHVTTSFVMKGYLQ